MICLYDLNPGDLVHFVDEKVLILENRRNESIRYSQLNEHIVVISKEVNYEQKWISVMFLTKNGLEYVSGTLEYYNQSLVGVNVIK